MIRITRIFMAMLYEHMHCFRQVPDAGAVARVRAKLHAVLQTERKVVKTGEIVDTD